MKHGWAYMDAVTRAIESWGDAVVAENAAAFSYRDADLRYAVERTLFFRLANDELLQALFDAAQDGATARMPTDAWSAALAPFLISPAAAPQASIPKLAFAKRTRNRIGNLLHLGRQPFRTRRLGGVADFLFLAIHPKFVSFMAPVAEALGERAAFLLARDPVVESHLLEKHLPHIVLDRAFSPVAPPRPVLAHFPALCTFFDSMTRMLEALRPRAILVPEGNAPLYEIANRAARRHGIPTICLQHGAPAYSNPGFRNWSYADVFVWGDAFIEPYARHNPGQHFTVTGTPAKLPAPRRPSTGAPITSIGFFLQKAATVIPAAEWAALLQFIGWAAGAFPEAQIIVRDHPTQPHLSDAERQLLGNRPNLRFMPPPAFSLNHVLSASDIVVAAASTTLLEALEAGAIPFVFGTAYPKDFPDIIGAGAGVQAPDLGAAKSILTRLIQDGAERRRLRAKGEAMAPALFAASGADGAARIAALLKTVATASRPS